MRKQVRKLRHWKQRWDKNADFVWTRYTVYAGERCEPGNPIPDDLRAKPTKLRRFWESGRIELAEFEAPNVATGQPEKPRLDDLPEDVIVEQLGGSWFLVRTPVEPDGVKVNGKRALAALLDNLRLLDDLQSSDNASLNGSSILESDYLIGDETVALGEIVTLTFEDSGLTAAEWNALAEETREEALAQSLIWMTDQGEDGVSEDGPEQPEQSEDEVPDATDGIGDVPDEVVTEASDGDSWLDGGEDE